MWGVLITPIIQLINSLSQGLTRTESLFFYHCLSKVNRNGPNQILNGLILRTSFDGLEEEAQNRIPHRTLTQKNKNEKFLQS